MRLSFCSEDLGLGSGSRLVSLASSVVHIPEAQSYVIAKKDKKNNNTRNETTPGPTRFGFVGHSAL